MNELKKPFFEYAPAIRTPGVSWLPIKGFDLLSWDTWKVDDQLKDYLTQNGIEPLIHRIGNRLVVCDLDDPHYQFDPIRVVYDPLEEYKETYEAESAAGYFGLQEIFWRKLDQALIGRYIRPHETLEYSVIPVFKYQKGYYLLIENIEDKTIGANVLGINYTGDADAIGRAEKREVKSNKGSFPGKYLSLYKPFFDKYLWLRTQINDIELKALELVFQDLSQSPDLEPLYEHMPREALFSILKSITHYTQLIGAFSDYKVDQGEISDDSKKRIEMLRNYVAVAIFKFLIPLINERYDVHLEEANYKKPISELSELMTKKFEKMAIGF